MTSVTGVNAASCMEQGARLVSFDIRFAAIDGLLRWDGTTD
ncbi:MAG: hypothetical protein WCQ50_08380 [Spirochaetota bacterium]